MNLVPAAVEPSPVAQHPRSPRRTRASWLIAGCYLLGALVVTGRLWADPAGRMQAGDTQDVNLFAWFLHYSAAAVSHGHLPALYTTALDAPRGVNMMWNTSILLPGILLSPVTLLAGPQVSLTVLLTLSLAGSAASLFWVLRRWGASLSAAALGGAVYGFSPALINSGLGHYHLALAVLPPLIIDALLRCCLVGPARAANEATPRSLRGTIRAGAWLGLLTAAQVFIAEEELVYTAVAALVLVLVIAIGHPRGLPGRVRGAAAGLATAAAVALAITGYPLWVQFFGPLREHNVLHGSRSVDLALYVDPPGNLLFHTAASEAAVARYPFGLPEDLVYLGWPLIVVLLVAAFWFRRDPRVRAAAVTCAVLELCSHGGGPALIDGLRLSGSFLPYHWLQGLPTMAQLIPGRFAILGMGAAGAVLAFSLDRARAAAPGTRAWRRGIPAVVAVLAVLPLIPVPYPTTSVPSAPPGWQAAFSRLRLTADDRVLVVPVTLVGHTQVMRWEADTAGPESMIGGYIIQPGRTGQATFSIGPTAAAAEYLNRLWSGHTHYLNPALVRSALASWRPAAVVAVTGEGSRLGRFLAILLGPPAFHVRRVVVWRL